MRVRPYLCRDEVGGSGVVGIIAYDLDREEEGEKVRFIIVTLSSHERFAPCLALMRRERETDMEG